MNVHRTLLNQELFPFQISQKYNKLVFIGSCFSEHLAIKCSEVGFDTFSNPFGVVFNSVSIQDQIELLANTKALDNKLYLTRDDHHFHFSAHSKFYGSEKQALEQNLKTLQDRFQKSMASQTVVFITLGTSYIYQLKNSGHIVANCHKQDSNLFQKRLLSIEEIKFSLEQSISAIKNLNKRTKVVMTLSPVRHLKDGMIENQRSKSRLLEAIHSVIETSQNCNYFPSYELILDDLRDYRYYNEDMIHPNNQAINYVWSYFQEVFFDKNTTDLAKEISMLKKRIQHRYSFPDSPASKKHQADTQQLIQEFQLKNKDLDIIF